MSIIKSLLHRVLSPIINVFRSRPSSNAYVEERLEYLLNEVSDLRIIGRRLEAEWAAAKDCEGGTGQTKESFSYQWENLKEGDALLGDQAFERQIMDLAAAYCGVEKSWFRGKTVLDAGCGIGRWSYAFLKLGAEVTAIDQSAQGIEYVQGLLSSQGTFRAQCADILEPLPFDSSFDLVWSFGVTHHTGNTKLAVENVARVVKPGGRLFLMIYGEPRSPGQFGEVNTYVKHRRATRFMSFEEKIAYLETLYPRDVVHGYFDAISPSINDLHRMDEIREWLDRLGFVNFKSTVEQRNHFVVADLPS